MKKNILLIIAITALCSSFAMAKTETISALSLRPHMSEGLSLPAANPSYLYLDYSQSDDFTMSVGDLDLKQGEVIKKLTIYIKIDHQSGAIYPFLGYVDIKTGVAVNIVGTEPGKMPDYADSYNNENTPGSEITKISVPLKVSGHVVNNKKYIYYFALGISSGGGHDVAFYGAKIKTK